MGGSEFSRFVKFQDRLLILFSQGPDGDDTFEDVHGDGLRELPVCANDDAYSLIRSQLGLGSEFNGEMDAPVSYGMDLDEDEDDAMDSEDDSDDD